jgi:hypothetical protein
MSSSTTTTIVSECNIIETLGEDATGCIFTFLSLSDINHFAQANRYMSRFIGPTSHLWQTLLTRYVSDEREQKQLLSNNNNSYRHVVKEIVLLQFDLKILNPKIIGSEALTFSNDNRTVKCYGDHDWASVKTKKQIQDNTLYAWKVRLDEYEHTNDSFGNSYKVVIGIENDKFPFYNQNPKDDVIGYYNSTGYSYITGVGSMNRQSKDRQVGKRCTSLRDGSVIQCIVDTRYPNNSLGFATFTLFYIDPENESAIEICRMDGIDLNENGLHYPAVSIIRGRRVTLQLCSKIIWPANN